MIKEGLHSLIARPLIFLLPFFIIGLVLGPRLTPWDNLLWPVSLFFTLLFLIWTVKEIRYPILIASIVFICIGSAFSASVYTPPDNPKHVYHLRDQSGLLREQRLHLRMALRHLRCGSAGTRGRVQRRGRLGLPVHRAGDGGLGAVIRPAGPPPARFDALPGLPTARGSSGRRRRNPDRGASGGSRR